MKTCIFGEGTELVRIVGCLSIRVFFHSNYYILIIHTKHFFPSFNSSTYSHLNSIFLLKVILV